MPNLFNEAEITDIKQTFQPIKSVNLSQLPAEFQRRFGERGEIEDIERQLDLERTRQSFEQQRQQELGEISRRGLGQGAFAESLTEQQDIQRQFGLTTKEVAKAVEPEIQKQFRMTQLRAEFAKKGIEQIRGLAQRSEQLMLRKFQQFSQRVEEKSFNELSQLKNKIEADHDRAFDELRSKLIKRETRSLIFGSLAKGLGMGVGALLAPFTGGLSIAAGASLGGAIGGAADGLFNIGASRR